MMSLLCGTLAETLRERGITGESRLQWLRSVLISALRGFALVPLVAPTSVAVAILTRELPQLSWSQLLPFGLVAALLMVLIGWVLEQSRFRKISNERVAVEGWLPGTGSLLALILVVFSLMAALVATTGFKVSVAAMLSDRNPDLHVVAGTWADTGFARGRGPGVEHAQRDGHFRRLCNPRCGIVRSDTGRCPGRPGGHRERRFPGGRSGHANDADVLDDRSYSDHGLECSGRFVATAGC